MTSLNHGPSKEQMLERQLGRMFGTLDVSPDFDARLMARIQGASEAEDAAQTAVANARARAQRQYRTAVEQVRIMRRWMLQLVTLDALAAIAVLLAVGSMLAQTTSVTLGSMLQSATYALSQYGPLIGTVLGILAAVIPLAAAIFTEKMMDSKRSFEI